MIVRPAQATDAAPLAAFRNPRIGDTAITFGSETGTEWASPPPLVSRR
ncbi:GNAT family N-acetyltransferase [Salipiger aestuarii]|uniref:Uncharacterized protein n=1 Tax=Salipiger aestuarii TaxID=568098 RepID=A0A327XYY3_9RHOB|nr:hypothetical protein [Salipiger aestuarii]EIE48683.1 hypothetical protein C357_22620 [Citreicella sp. 357]RAK13940.1 hypothetical protein ATI53_103234 [Salipiger aestuarii]